MSDIEDDLYDDELDQEEEIPIATEEDDEEKQKLEAELDEAAGMEEEEDDKKEEEEKIPDKPLTDEMAAESLSLLSRVGDGLAHAYVRLDLREKEITDISILERFIHLRFIDLSKNHIKDLSPLSTISHLITLKADQNHLQTVKMDELPYLQRASFQKNKITSTEGIVHPMLEQLVLSFNEITVIAGLEANKLKMLHTLELRGNKLESTAGIDLPNLRNLFLAGNVLKRLEGLENLVSLATLHMRDNQLESLDGFSENNKLLQYINMRGNDIKSSKEVEKMKVLPSLKALVISENPASEDDEFRFEVIVAVPQLVRLDKDEILEDERKEAEELHEHKQKELAAKAAEEAAAAAEQAPTSEEEMPQEE